MLSTMTVVEQKKKAIVGDGQLPKEQHVQVWSEIWAVHMEENAPDTSFKQGQTVAGSQQSSKGLWAGLQLQVLISNL